VYWNIEDMEDILAVFSPDDGDSTNEKGDEIEARKVTTTHADKVALAQIQLNLALAEETRARECLASVTAEREKKEGELAAIRASASGA
jgi:beta-lactamase class A